MKWKELLDIVGREPCFTSSLLMAGKEASGGIRLQLSRWVATGKIIQLRRGLYLLAEPYRKVSPHPFLLANNLKKASYVSLQSALGFYGLIPEYVPSVTCVTTMRPETIENPEGNFIFKHVKKSFFNNYQQIVLSDQQTAFIASPEKALLDLIYLMPHADSPEYLQELRLQNTSTINLESLKHIAESSESPKLTRATKQIINLISQEQYKEL